jgi:hypothetical protein
VKGLSDRSQICTIREGKKKRKRKKRRKRRRKM